MSESDDDPTRRALTVAVVEETHATKFRTILTLTSIRQPDRNHRLQSFRLPLMAT